MSSGIQLIVGLGNPGQKYEQTRHNAGAWFVTELAQASHVVLRKETKYHGLHAQIVLHHQECHLLIPTTFMNLSGQAIQAVANYYKIPPANILVAHDELDLPVGEVRLKFDGGHGGHNGLRDTIEHLNTKQFYQLRIGIGRPPQHSEEEAVDYVLNPPSKAERKIIDTALHDANKILPHLMEGQFQQAMHELHTKK